MLYLIVWSHVCIQSVLCHLRQISRTIVKCFKVRAYGIAQVCNHSCSILGKFACTFLQMVNSHLRTNGKYFRVYAHVHLTEQLLTHTLTEFCIAFIGNKTVATRIIFRLRFLLCGFRFFCTYNLPNLNLVFKNGFNSVTQFLIEILGITYNLQHFFRTVCRIIETSIPDRDRAAHIIALQRGQSGFLVNGNRILPHRAVFLLFFLLRCFQKLRLSKLHIAVIYF